VRRATWPARAPTRFCTIRRAPSESAAIPETSTIDRRPRRAPPSSVGARARLERVDRAAVLKPGADSGNEPAAADADEHAVGNSGSASTSAAKVPAPATTSRWS
jgi:hypothetical protein